jgi:hypothetical protein
MLEMRGQWARMQRSFASWCAALRRGLVSRKHSAEAALAAVAAAADAARAELGQVRVNCRRH